MSCSTGGTKRWFHYDGNGNVIAVLDTNHAIVSHLEYGPFGTVLTKTGSHTPRYQFSTKEFDAAAGPNYYGVRYYSPSPGRWITRDPLGEIGGINLYGVGNDLINNVDSRGLSIKSAIREIGKAIAGPGKIHVDSNCKKNKCPAKTLPEGPWTPENPNWGDLPDPGGSQVTDGIATPRGILKIPNGVDCHVRCTSSGSPTKVECYKRPYAPFSPDPELNPPNYPPNPYVPVPQPSGG